MRFILSLMVWTVPVLSGPVLEMDQDFFLDQGRIENAPPNQYGCTTVTGRNERSEAQRLGAKMQRYCAGEVSVMFIRDRQRFSTFKLRSVREGYYQLCCRRKSSQSRRRARRNRRNRTYTD